MYLPWLAYLKVIFVKRKMGLTTFGTFWGLLFQSCSFLFLANPSLKPSQKVLRL